MTSIVKGEIGAGRVDEGDERGEIIHWVGGIEEGGKREPLVR